MQLTSAIVFFILALAAFVGATYHVIPASKSNHITTCGPTFGTGNNNTISICLDQFDQLLGINDDKESDPFKSYFITIFVEISGSNARCIYVNYLNDISQLEYLFYSVPISIPNRLDWIRPSVNLFRYLANLIPIDDGRARRQVNAMYSD
ncbi:hypothetical protein BDQ17DRAFT_1335295 [Cyathus striatus]|nr:hypothetical protein BDQ17DRAFT_1335295 [Cyathus striatus]